MSGEEVLTLAEKRRCEALKANGGQCGAWAIPGKTVCAGHDDDCQQRSRQAIEDRARSLESLPELKDAASAERFLSRVALLVARGVVKPDLARELRLLGKDFASVHTSRLASVEFEKLKRRVAELEGEREPWR